jgi:hypothetical protein
MQICLETPQLRDAALGRARIATDCRMSHTARHTQFYRFIFSGNVA